MEQKTIIIKGKPFVYNDESKDINYDNTAPMTEESARELIILTQKLFLEIGLQVGLAFGTLLGAVREGGLIKGDLDVDVYVDDEQTMYDNLQYLSDHGLKLCRLYRHECYSFKAEVSTMAYIDVYIKRPCGRFSVWQFGNCIFHHNVTPKKYFENGMQDITFMGVPCKCVKNPEQLLEFWYGKTWRIPISSQGEYHCEIPLAHFVHTFPKRFLKAIIGYKYWKPLAKPDGKHWWFSSKCNKQARQS